MASLRETVRALRAGEVRAVALAERALAAQRLGAYRHVDAARTLALAGAADAAFAVGVDLGALQGVPCSIKDLYGVPGWPTSAGTPHVLPASFTEAGPVVARLLDQLGVVTGKTHTVELAFGGIGTNPHAGTPVNPWDATSHRVPGGSSAGAGVSLVEGSAWVAFGTDTAGSVRIPAAWTGTVGLKTTAGRWSTAGIVPLSSTLDTAGILARDVGDLALAFAALDPRPGRVDEGLAEARIRLGRAPTPLWEGCSAGVVEAVDAALADLPAGWSVDEAELPGMTEAMTLFGAGGPVAAELDAFLSQCLPGVRDTLDPNVERRVASAGETPVREYLRRRHRLTVIAAQARAAFVHHDAIVCPTVANTPPTVASLADPATYGAQNLLCLRNTAVVSYLGLCALTVPVGLDAAGMPVGLMLVGPPGGEERLLGLGLAVEQTLGTAAQRLGPPPRLG